MKVVPPVRATSSPVATGEDVAKLRSELGVASAAETELVLIVVKHVQLLEAAKKRSFSP